MRKSYKLSLNHLREMTKNMEIKGLLDQIKGHIQDNTKEIKSLIEQQEAEIKANGAATEETGKKLDAATKRLDELQAEYKEKIDKFTEEHKAAAARLDEMEKKAGRLGTAGGESRKSLGELFTGSDEYKKFLKSGDSKSRSFAVKSFERFAKKTITGAALGAVDGYLYSSERVTEWMRAPERTDRVRDLIPVLPTGQGAIEFVRETGFTNNAAPVPEFDADDETEKPKSAITFEIVNLSVKTIAHWLPATRQIINDSTQLKSYIDSRLIYGLKLAEDEQVLYGDGLGENLQGILTQAGIQTYNWSAGNVGDTKIDAVRRAMTKALVAHYPVSGVVLHPNDWEDIELAKGSDGHYIWVIVTEGGQQRLWRAPVVVTTAINQDDFLTGAFEMGTALWDREEAAIRVTDSHDDFFTKNLWAILAEERLCQTIYRPEGFVKGSFDNEPA